MKRTAKSLTSTLLPGGALSALLVCTLLTTPASAQWGAPDWKPEHPPKFETFEVPGATTTVSKLCTGFCGTQALAMNDEGTVVGSWTDALVVPHAFIRTRDGEFIVFDAPKAGTGAYLVQGTVPYTINNFGVVAGQYEDAHNVYHGFIRHPDNTYEVIDAPGADTTVNSGNGTLILSNNDKNDTAGIYIDKTGTVHSFYRSRDGVIANIKIDGSIYTRVCEETCLSPDGTAVGSYFGSSDNLKGFLRTRDGKITTFTAPDAGVGRYIGTFVASISSDGEIAGYVVDDAGLAHGFVRHRDGTFSKDFEVKEAYMGPSGGTAPFSISGFGATTGIYIDANGGFHGFERTMSGHVATFDAAASVAGSGAGQGTRPSVNNLEGRVAGWTTDATGLLHGFVWIP